VKRALFGAMASEPEATPTAVEETPEKEKQKYEPEDTVEDKGEVQKVEAQASAEEEKAKDVKEDEQGEEQDDVADDFDHDADNSEFKHDQEPGSGGASSSTGRWKSKSVHEFYMMNCLLVKPGTGEMMLELKKKNLTVDMLQKGLTDNFYSRFVAKIRSLQPQVKHHFYIDVDVSESQLGPPAMKLLADFFKKLYKEPTPICIRSFRAYRNDLGDEGVRHVADLIICQPAPMTQLHLSHNSLSGLGTACVTLATAASSQYPFRVSGKQSTWCGLWMRMEQNEVVAPNALFDSMQGKRVEAAPLWIEGASLTNKNWGPCKAPSWATSQDTAPHAVLYLFTMQLKTGSKGARRQEETEATREEAVEQVKAATEIVLALKEAAPSVKDTVKEEQAHKFERDEREEDWEEETYDRTSKGKSQETTSKPRLIWKRKPDSHKDEKDEKDEKEEEEEDLSSAQRPSPAQPSSSKGSGKASSRQAQTGYAKGDSSKNTRSDSGFGHKSDWRWNDGWDEEDWDVHGKWEDWKAPAWSDGKSSKSTIGADTRSKGSTSSRPRGETAKPKQDWVPRLTPAGQAEAVSHEAAKDWKDTADAAEDKGKKPVTRPQKKDPEHVPEEASETSTANPRFLSRMLGISLQDQAEKATRQKATTLSDREPVGSWPKERAKAKAKGNPKQSFQPVKKPASRPPPPPPSTPPELPSTQPELTVPAGVGNAAEDKSTTTGTAAEDANADTLATKKKGKNKMSKESGPIESEVYVIQAGFVYQ